MTTTVVGFWLLSVLTLLLLLLLCLILVVGPFIVVRGSISWFMVLRLAQDSYYLIMYNAATGWWLARYDKGFSGVLANISIPTPMNNNVAVAKYSAFAANDYGVVLINSDGQCCGV